MPVEGRMMKIIYEKHRLNKALEELTYQRPLVPPKCICGTQTLPLMVIDDKDGLIAEQRLESSLWPYDSMIIALYLCPVCGKLFSDQIGF